MKFNTTTLQPLCKALEHALQNVQFAAQPFIPGDNCYQYVVLESSHTMPRIPGFSAKENFFMPFFNKMNWVGACEEICKALKDATFTVRSVRVLRRKYYDKEGNYLRTGYSIVADLSGSAVRVLGTFLAPTDNLYVTLFTGGTEDATSPQKEYQDRGIGAVTMEQRESVDILANSAKGSSSF